MKRLYSQTTGCCYIEGIHAEMPADAVPISSECYEVVIANPTLGKIRNHDADGLPFLIDPPLPGPIELLETAYARQIETINTACTDAITAGFTSGALGAPHRYTSQLDDQLNLTGSILRGLDMPYACRDEQGEKEFRAHTAEQLRQVGDDFTVYKLELLRRANTLKQQVEQALAASDLSTLEAVIWESVQ